MKCLSTMNMIKFAERDFSEAKTQQAVEHIKGCINCQRELSELAKLYTVLNLAVNRTECFPNKVLECYVNNTCGHITHALVEKHLSSCGDCRSRLQLAQKRACSAN